jgi:predicted Zn-dependent peptidase
MRKSSIRAAIALIAVTLALGLTFASAPSGHAQRGRGAGRGHAAATPSTSAAEALAGIAIERQTLDNGLRVVVNADHTVPTVAIAVYYDVGSRNEERGRSGFAHLFEHLMFEGSANVARNEHFTYIAARGGDANATTSDDRTNYFETLPSNELALGLWLEADRMASLDISEEAFANQRTTVLQERQQNYESQPYALSFLRANELAYGDYFPYAHSTIGDVQDVVNSPLSAVQEFWQRHYAPNNAVLVIAGDVEPAEAFAMARQYFGAIPRRDVVPYAPGELAPQTAERRESMVDPLADLPAFHVEWHIPPNREPDHYALELLSAVLGDGESSRLYRSLVHEQEILSEIGVGTDDRRGPDLFSVFGLVQEDHTAEEGRAAVYAAIADIAAHGVPEREMERVHNRMRAYFVMNVQSNLMRAEHLAEYELYYGDATLLRTELDRYLAVTSADIQRVAGQYFTETNRTVLDVVPPPETEGGAQ